MPGTWDDDAIRTEADLSGYMSVDRVDELAHELALAAALDRSRATLSPDSSYASTRLKQRLFQAMAEQSAGDFQSTSRSQQLPLTDDRDTPRSSPDPSNRAESESSVGTVGDPLTLPRRPEDRSSQLPGNAQYFGASSIALSTTIGTLLATGGLGGTILLAGSTQWLALVSFLTGLVSIALTLYTSSRRRRYIVAAEKLIAYAGGIPSSNPQYLGSLTKIRDTLLELGAPRVADKFTAYLANATRTWPASATSE